MPSGLTYRVARRYLASYFSVGDTVLYGRWKNHTGKIVAFSQDHWGNPTIEVEPVPKGRKGNKVFGLFKVWRADVKENAMKKLLEKQAGDTMNSTKRVVARYIKQAGIEEGRVYVSAEDNVRIQRWRDHFRVWDLTNAGKRGKSVEGFVLSTTHYYKGDAAAWMDNMGKVLPEQGDYNAIVRLIKDVQHDYPNEIEMSEFKEKGINVLPASSAPIQLETDTGIRIKADPLDFSVVNSVKHMGPKGNSFNQDTLFSPRNKKDALLFYTWLKTNLSKVNKMDMNTLRDTWSSEGVQYDYH